jgi:hypothetical protein
MKMSKTEIALEKIRIDYATNGKDSGVATLQFIENRISRARYNEYANKGLKQFRIAAAHNQRDATT